MDFKVADLRKKFNKLKFNAKTKTDKLNSLMKEYEKVVRLNAEMVRQVDQNFSHSIYDWPSLLKSRCTHYCQPHTE